MALMNPAEREIWRIEYLTAAMAVSGRRRPTRQMERWAHAMSLIADEHADGSDDDLVDAA